MKRQDILSIAITFAMGFVAGIYLYISGFAGLMTQLTVDDIASIDEFIIVADAYGGCRADCPSFQVQSDGDYRYLYSPERGAEQVLREGTLPLDLRRELRSSVTLRALALQSKTVDPVTCESYRDGTDVVYSITVEGVEYVIDSCGTNVDPSSELWLALNSIWEYYGSL